jgi:beta-lactamase regulating signal transducer with metallopeptidase domain
MTSEILVRLLTANILAGIAILLVMLARGPVRRMVGARIAYWLWVAPVLAGAAALVPARTEIVKLAAFVEVPATDPVHVLPVTAAVPPATAAPALPPIDIEAMLLAVWIIGALALLALTLIRQRQTVRRMGGDIGPAIVGVVRPRVVLPADFETRFSPRERDMVIAHERAHLAGGHTRVNAVVVLLTALNWFNPLVHIAAKLARVDQELACDAAVVERFPGERRIYAEALLKTQIVHGALPLGCTWPSRSYNLLKERVTMLALKSPGRIRRSAGFALIAALTLGAGLTAWAARPAEPVYVEDQQPRPPRPPTTPPAPEGFVPVEKPQPARDEGFVPVEVPAAPAAPAADAAIAVPPAPPARPAVEAPAAVELPPAPPARPVFAAPAAVEEAPPPPPVFEAKAEPFFVVVPDPNEPMDRETVLKMLMKQKPQSHVIRNATYVCDVWTGKYTNAGLKGFDWRDFNDKAAVRLTFDKDGKAAVSLPDDAFPPGTFPAHGKPTGNARFMDSNSMSYRYMSAELIDSLTFMDLDQQPSKVKWERILPTPSGPKDTFLDGYCRRT